MLAKFLTKPIELNIGNKSIIFSTIDDFEFSLNARTAITPDRITETFSATLDELNEESSSIDIALKELGSLISQSPEVSGGINMRLKLIDTSIFSKEHNWRDIFIALNGYDSLPLSRYKNIALKMYLRYLKNRLNIIKSIKNHLQTNKSTLEQQKKDNENATIFSNSLSLTTLESDVGVLNSELDLVRIPKANPIDLVIIDGEAIDIYVSKHKCKLVARNGIKFIDTDNIEYTLQLGENKIGRGKGCTVKLNEGMREISRLHLLIVNHDHRKLQLTDLSVQGTYLTKEVYGV